MADITIGGLTAAAAAALTDKYEIEQSGPTSKYVTGTQLLALMAANLSFQPLDSDLTAIAALTTTSFGRAFLELANAGAGRTALGLGTAAVAATGDFEAAGAVATHDADTTNVHGIADTSALLTSAAAAAAYQPLDSDLTAIAALTTTSYGRAFLALADAAAARSALSLGTAAQANTGTSSGNVPTVDQADLRYQPLDSDLTAIAALTTTSFGRALLALADAAALRTAAALGSIATLSSIATANIDNDAVTYAKMQNVSATSRILGRATSGAGDVEELTGAQALEITGAQIAIPEGRGRTSGGVNNLSIPGLESAAQSTTGVTSNRLVYEPILIPTAITIDLLAVEVTTLFVGGLMRLGIYNADVHWQPTSLVLDAGTVATDTLGVKSISINQALPAGRYLFAFVMNSSTPQFRTARGGSRLYGYNPALGTTIFTASVQVTFAFGTLPDPGTAWDTPNYVNSGNSHLIFCRESVP